MKAAYWIFLAVLATQMSCIHSGFIEGIEFTSKNSDGVNLFFDSEINYSLGFSTCLRVMFTYLNANKIFNSQNIISLKLEEYSSEKMFVEILGIKHYFQWPSQTLDLQPYVWYVFCTSYDAEEKLVSFTVDDQIIFQESSEQTDQEFIGNHILFSGMADFPFIGMITDFNVWNKSLTDDEIQNFVFCKYDFNSKLTFNWANANFSQIGKHNQIVSIPMEDICIYPPPSKIRWFQTPMNYESAIFVGLYLNGEMYLPANNTSLNYLFTNTGLNIISNASFWVPIVRAKENSSVWVNGYNKSEDVKYLPWMKGQPNGYPIQNCVKAQLAEYGYNDIDCESERSFNVNAAKSPIFHLRGPCIAGDNFDSKYVYNFDAGKSNQYLFQGFSGKSIIIRNANVWNLKVYNTTLNEFVLTAFSLKTSKFPFGTQNWTFYKDCENMYWKNSLIKLTKVRFFLSKLLGS
jgi:hypothetical protein